MVVLDNLSQVKQWLSDALCRLATGGGFATRQLYYDTDEIIFDAQRPIILNGIEELATRSDLLDRSILVTLEPIAAERRRTEKSLWENFDRQHPLLLGALLDAVSTGLRRLSEVRLTELPRMADFAQWAVACEPGLPIEPGTFLQRYTANRDAADEIALEASPIASALATLMSGRPAWSGTPRQLHEELTRVIQRRPSADHSGSSQLPRSWPPNAQRLSAELRLLMPNLRRAGMNVVIDRRHHRHITITTAGASHDLRAARGVVSSGRMASAAPAGNGVAGSGALGSS